MTIVRRLYPLEISMYHHLTMHIYQSPGDIFELPGVIPLVRDVVNSRKKILQAQTDSRPYVPR